MVNTINTIQDLIAAARVQHAKNKTGWGHASNGRFMVNVVDVGRPSVGYSSAVTTRLDWTMDGRRVARKVVEAEWNR